MECEYPKCNQEAVIRLGLADPDAVGSVYCRGHADIRKHEIMMEMFGWRDEKCITMVDGRSCYNAKKFGDYCGIHIKYQDAHKGEKDER